MKKIVTSAFGNIYYASILKNGTMGQDKVNVTDDCLFATMQHLQSANAFCEKGFSGYIYPNQEDESKSITLAAYTEAHTCIAKSVLDELYQKIERLEKENESLKEELGKEEEEDVER